MEKERILKRIYIQMAFLAVACMFFSAGAAILLKDAVNLLLGLVMVVAVGYNAMVLREDIRKNKLETIYATCCEAQGSALSKKALFRFETTSPIKGTVIYIKASKVEYLEGLEYCLLFRNPNGEYNENTLLGSLLRINYSLSETDRENRQIEENAV